MTPTDGERCQRCDDPPDWHRHDDSARPFEDGHNSHGAIPGDEARCPTRCIGYDCTAAGTSPPPVPCGCPDYVPPPPVAAEVVCGAVEEGCRCINAPHQGGPHRCACGGSWEITPAGEFVIHALPPGRPDWATSPEGEPWPGTVVFPEHLDGLGALAALASLFPIQATRGGITYLPQPPEQPELAAGPGPESPVATAYRWTNGMVMAFGPGGEQIPELQGPWTAELADAITARATALTRYVGWPPDEPVRWVRP